MLFGSAQTRSTASESSACTMCAAAAIQAQATAARAPRPTRRPFLTRRLFLEELQAAGLDLAIGTTFQIGVQTFPVLVDHLAGIERRHPLLRTAIHDRGMEIFLRQYFQRFDQRRTHQSLLFGAVAALASQGSPGFPAV